jgi:hypothetical protein
MFLLNNRLAVIEVEVGLAKITLNPSSLVFTGVLFVEVSEVISEEGFISCFWHATSNVVAMAIFIINLKDAIK